MYNWAGDGLTSSCLSVSVASGIRWKYSLRVVRMKRSMMQHNIEIFTGGITMNKTELVAAIAEKTELSRKDAEKALKAFTEVVTEQLKSGEKVQLVGFGTFEVAVRPEREGRNPQTGETMKIAASKMPKFKAGKALKDTVNE